MYHILFMKAKSKFHKVINDFDRFISDFPQMGVSDYEYINDGILVFVKFGLCIGNLLTDSIEVLNEDYEPIQDNDSIVIINSIKQSINNYNLENRSRESNINNELDYRNHVIFGLYY